MTQFNLPGKIAFAVFEIPKEIMGKPQCFFIPTFNLKFLNLFEYTN